VASEDLSGHHLLDRHDNLGLDLLHRDIERLLGRTDEPHDDRFEIVSGAEFGGTDESLDRATGEVGHAGSRTDEERGGKALTVRRIRFRRCRLRVVRISTV
jgi:hypothetical protein